MIIRQSDLSSFSYCAMRQNYDREAESGGRERPRLSRMIYGTVIHFALEVMQRAVHAGDPDALAVGLATFAHYWNPEHTAEISEGPPNVWAAKDTYGGMAIQARESLKAAYEWMTKGPGSKDVLLGTEVTFDLPIMIDDEEHTLHGTIDRFVLRMIDRIPTVGVDDWKSGIKPDHLQHNMQISVYSWASTQVGFWQQFESEGFQELERRVNSRGYDLYHSPDGLPLAPRRGRWISVKGGGFAAADAGWRVEAHYKRMRLMISQYIKAMRADVHPLTTDTAKCNFCQWRDICGDAPLAPHQEDVDIRGY